MLVELDDPTTWPIGVAEWVTSRAAQHRDVSESWLLSSLLRDDEEDFRQLFAGTKFRCYHCTRLRDQEVPLMREQGLRLLTRELVEERIERAYSDGDLDAAQRERYLRSHTFALGTEGPREGRIDLLIGRSVLNDYVWESLLSIWGGEAIYMEMAEEWPRLRRIGRPAIVMAAVDLSSATHIKWMSRRLAAVFVGMQLGVTEKGASIAYKAAIPGEDIIDIWQPGNRDYDQHDLLPST